MSDDAGFDGGQDEFDVMESIDSSLANIAESLQDLVEVEKDNSKALGESTETIAKIDAIVSTIINLSVSQDELVKGILKTCYDKLNKLLKEL